MIANWIKVQGPIAIWNIEYLSCNIVHLDVLINHMLEKPWCSGYTEAGAFRSRELFVMFEFLCTLTHWNRVRGRGGAGQAAIFHWVSSNRPHGSGGGGTRSGSFAGTAYCIFLQLFSGFLLSLNIINVNKSRNFQRCGDLCRKWNVAAIGVTPTAFAPLSRCNLRVGLLCAQARFRPLFPMYRFWPGRYLHFLTKQS